MSDDDRHFEQFSNDFAYFEELARLDSHLDGVEISLRKRESIANFIGGIRLALTETLYEAKDVFGTREGRREMLGNLDAYFRRGRTVDYDESEFPAPEDNEDY